MKNIVFVILSFLIPSLVIAENRGVADTNYSLSGSVTNSENGDFNFGSNNLKINALFGLATIGLGKYGGATGYLNFSEYNFSYSEYDLKASDNAYGGLLFLRDASIGRVGIAYDKSNVVYDVINTDPVNNIVAYELPYSITTYSVFLDYYYQEYSFALEHNSVKKVNSWSDDSNDTILSLSGVWHINENFLLRVSTFVNGVNKSNGLTFIYQPEFLNRSTSFSLKYLKRNAQGESSFSVFAVNYYFATRVSLKDRERKYSSYLYSNYINQL